MRNYVPCWDKIGITKDRYLELLYFCRQYPTWKTEAQSYIGLRGRGMDGQPHGTGISDPVFRAAEKRAAIMAKIDLVEGCAREVGGGLWFTALILNICKGRPLSAIDPVLMPTANRAAFFAARKEFFARLDELKHDRREDNG